MLRYPVELSREKNVILAFVPDLPGTQTFGDDAIETMLMGVIGDREEIPVPSRVKRGERSVALPALTEAKISLYTEMRRQRIGKADLARRLNCHLPQIDRLLDLAHSSRFDQLEAAFLALGKRLAISFEDAA